MCLQLGIDDPVHWLETVPESVIDLWEAYYQVEPWGNEWQQTADQLAMLTNVISVIAAANGGKAEAIDSVEFMPFDSRQYQRGKVQPKGITDPKLQEQCLVASFGFRP